REQAKSDPLLDSTMRFIEHLRDYRENLAEAAVRRYEATEQWIECPKCETEVPTSNGIHCPNCGEDMRGGEYVRAILHLVDDADGRIYRGIDSLTVRSAGFPEYRGMALYLIQGPPGTGKTTAIVESIRRILGRNPNASILMSSHSNDAVDTGQERLLGFSHVRQARIAEPGKVPRRLRPTLVESDDLEPYNLVAGTCNRLTIDSRLRFKVFDWLILDEANKVRAN